MAYQGPVAAMLEEMVRERSALALAGETPRPPEFCPIAARVLRARLLTAWSPDLLIVGLKHYRPWRLGTEMVGPKWFWQGVARVVNDPDTPVFVQVWTRKAHRAWRRESLATSSVASAILQGEVKDAYWW